MIEKRPVCDSFLPYNFWSNYIVLLMTNILFSHKSHVSSEFSLGKNLQIEINLGFT